MLQYVVPAIIAILTFVLGKIIYDRINFKKNEDQAGRTFISRLDLLRGTEDVFQARYIDYIEYLFKKIEVTFLSSSLGLQIECPETHGLKSPNVQELSYLNPFTKYYLLKISSYLVRREDHIIKANNYINKLEFADGKTDDIKDELRYVLRTIISISRSIRINISHAMESIVFFDLKRHGNFYYFSKFDCLGDLLRYDLEPISLLENFQIKNGKLYLPKSKSEIESDEISYYINKISFKIKSIIEIVTKSLKKL
ncbi:MAG: hypothetical protein JSW64_13250 [Candidatus Zixiibacteriota bacterium]|nr:MAG: hypothetical protein JSW64_13250 [candidate division Zixibacteria bacterium]